MGPMGSNGPNGNLGNVGPPGPIGDIGDKGNKGTSGDKGSVGRKGQPGLKGLKGSSGQTGNKGVSGRPGRPGPSGPSGNQGEKGYMGPKGSNGTDGNIGIPGNGAGMGMLTVIHSQTTTIPQCPTPYRELWYGYSFLYIKGNGYGSGQDLGDPGSCLPVFSTMPYMRCLSSSKSPQERCEYAVTNDESYWLSTNESRPMMGFVHGNGIEQFISRCVVCEVESTVSAVHSQTDEIPACYAGWESMWTGYSIMQVSLFYTNTKPLAVKYYLQVTGASAEGGMQGLDASGSCLQQFHVQPFVKCGGSGSGRCSFDASSLSFWLTTLNPFDQFKVNKETLKGRDAIIKRVSRCRVCMWTEKAMPTSPISLHDIELEP
jgi:integrin beta 8